MGGGRIIKAEYCREYAGYLRAMARYLRDDSCAKLLNMACHFEEMAKAAENEPRSSSVNENCELKEKAHREPRPGSVTTASTRAAERTSAATSIRGDQQRLPRRAATKGLRVTQR
jgi:hypothetical protein